MGRNFSRLRDLLNSKRTNFREEHFKGILLLIAMQKTRMIINFTHIGKRNPHAGMRSCHTSFSRQKIEGQILNGHNYIFMLFSPMGPLFFSALVLHHKNCSVR